MRLRFGGIFAGFVLGGVVSAIVVTSILFFGGPYFLCKGSILCVGSAEVGDASQVHLSWREDPATTLSVIWRTASFDNPARVEYRPVGSDTWQQADGRSARTPRNGLYPAAGVIHTATLTGLRPDTEYEYRVSSDRKALRPTSAVFRTRTAPPTGQPADFSFVFFADTGLTGRIDGLDTGTAQIREEVAREDALFLLGGGDYAYADKDGRFDTAPRAIDEWFRQWEPVLARKPFMAQYGNHEAYLDERVSMWAGRFAYPPGFKDGRAYSFDVGDVHFTAMYAPDQNYVPEADLVEWLDRDLAEARARGMRWLIVYQHQAMYGYGKSHPSRPEVTSLLAPVFQRHKVDLHLNAHDQSYERTYPLVGDPLEPTVTDDAPNEYRAGSGVIYAKISPAGKESQITGGFSTFTVPQQPFMAVRDDTAHHYAVLSVEAAGALEMKVYAVRGDGSPRRLIDRVRIVADGATVAQSRD